MSEEPLLTWSAQRKMLHVRFKDHSMAIADWEKTLSDDELLAELRRRFIAKGWEVWSV